MELKRLTYENPSSSARQLLNKWQNSKEKVNRNDWHTHYILQCYLVATRSLDAQTQCGCIIVKNKTIIGTGYNSFIRDIPNEILPNVRPDKYPFMVHGEHNAILNCARNGIACNGATAYITGPPCCDCLQFMYQAGIENIYFPNYNIANMTQNDEYKTRFEILVSLMPRVNIVQIDLDATTIEKIEKIKSCR